jgi:pre-mRNA-splicing factor 18
MDFASLMKKEMSKSKKPPASTTDAKDAAASKKYMKRSEIEAERQAAYLAEKKAIEDARVAKLAEKRKREEEAAAEDAEREEKRRRLAEESRRVREEKEWEEEQARRRRLGLPEKKRRDKGAEEENEQEAELGAGEEDIAEEELVAKLRDLGEPVVLFWEGHRGRLRRYRRLTTVVTKGPIPTTLQLVEEKDMKIDGKVPQDPEERRWLFRQLASYFIMVMTAYEQAMEAESRDTTASRNAYAAMVQTRENIKPVRPFLPLSLRAMGTNITSSYSANSRRVILRIPCWSQSWRS